MVNIRDIAKAAQVSPGTVSRVLNHDPSLSIHEHTRDRILQTCQTLNYIPRKYGNRKNSPSVGIISVVSRELESDDSYYRQIREKLTLALKSETFYIDFMIFLPDLTSNWHRVKTVDCMIVIGFIQHELHDQLYQLNPNLIILDDPDCDKRYSSIAMDLYQETLSILDKAGDFGHQRIALISGKNGRLAIDGLIDELEVSEVLGERERAYDDWMVSHDLSADRQRLTGETWYAQSGYEATEKLLASPEPLPSLIIAGSDILALGIIRKLSEVGLAVPKDISICSFDDLELATFLTPSLTSLKINIDQMVAWCLVLCKKITQDKDFLPTKITLSGQLMLRESFQKLRL